MSLAVTAKDEDEKRCLMLVANYCGFVDKVSCQLGAETSTTSGEAVAGLNTVAGVIATAAGKGPQLLGDTPEAQAQVGGSVLRWGRTRPWLDLPKGFMSRVAPWLATAANGPTSSSLLSHVHLPRRSVSPNTCSREPLSQSPAHTSPLLPLPGGGVADVPAHTPHAADRRQPPEGGRRGGGLPAWLCTDAKS